jgi:hypothetical protein
VGDHHDREIAAVLADQNGAYRTAVLIRAGMCFGSIFRSAIQEVGVDKLVEVLNQADCPRWTNAAKLFADLPGEVKEALRLPANGQYWH